MPPFAAAGAGAVLSLHITLMAKMSLVMVSDGWAASHRAGAMSHTQRQHVARVINQEVAARKAKIISQQIEA